MAHHIRYLKSEKIRANFQPREPNKKSPFLFHFVVSFYVNNPPRGTSGVEGYFLIKPAYPPSYDELLKGVKVCLFFLIGNQMEILIMTVMHGRLE